MFFSGRKLFWPMEVGKKNQPPNGGILTSLIRSWDAWIGGKLYHWCFRNPANSPVEVKVVYPITYDLQGFITIPAGEPDFFQQFVFYGWSTYPDSPRLAPLPSGFGGKSLEEWPVAGRRDLGLWNGGRWTNGAQAKKAMKSPVVGKDEIGKWFKLRNILDSRTAIQEDFFKVRIWCRRWAFLVYNIAEAA